MALIYNECFQIVMDNLREKYCKTLTLLSRTILLSYAKPALISASSLAVVDYNHAESCIVDRLSHK
jgi:hypothetical protein